MPRRKNNKDIEAIYRFTWFGVLVLHPALVHHRQELVIVAFIGTACAVIRQGFFWVKDKGKMSQFNVVSLEPKTRGRKNISLGSLVKVGLETIWQVDHPPCSTLLSLLAVVDHRLEGDVSVSLFRDHSVSIHSNDNHLIIEACQIIVVVKHARCWAVPYDWGSDSLGGFGDNYHLYSVKISSFWMNMPPASYFASFFKKYTSHFPDKFHILKIGGL